MGKILKFSGNNINRLEVERRDVNWIDSQINDDNSKVIVYYKSKVLVKKIFTNISLKFLTLGEIKSKGIEPEVILLGSISEEIYLTTDLSKFDEDLVNSLLSKSDEFINCRTAGDQLAQNQGGMISQSKSQLEWNSKNLFCGMP